jgi:hypothetical protein
MALASRLGRESIRKARRQARPLRRFKASGRGIAGIAPFDTGSREVGGSSEGCLQAERGAIGFPAGHGRRAFAPIAFSPSPSPVAFTRRVHPPTNLPPLQSTAIRCLLPITSSRPATACDVESASHGVRMGPLRDINRPEPLLQRAPRSLLRSVLGVPPALDGLLPARSCGFVSPRSRVQGSRPSGVPASPRSRVESSPTDALVPLRPASLRLPAPRRLLPTSGRCSPRRVR